MRTAFSLRLPISPKKSALEIQHTASPPARSPHALAKRLWQNRTACAWATKMSNAKPVIVVVSEGGQQYRVTVTEGASKTTHLVTVSSREHERYAPTATTDALIRKSFEFLLGRESKESVLREFRLCEIEKYFPDFVSHISKIA
jgi:hypothetical protein